MKAPIKFRAWHKNTMHEVVSLRFWGINRKITTATLINNNEEFDEDNFDGETSFILMQSTGLCDKNGKEIFEGDIIRKDNGNVLLVVWNGKHARWSSYRDANTSKAALYRHAPHHTEVIGNIYDNPEMFSEK